MFIRAVKFCLPLSHGGHRLLPEKEASRRASFYKGDVIKCAPGVEHWHGATPNDSFACIAVTPTAKGKTIWLGSPSPVKDYNSVVRSALSRCARVVMRSFCASCSALLIFAPHPLQMSKVPGRLSGECPVSNTNQPARYASSIQTSEYIDSTISDVIAHPAFAGIGRLILPRDGRNPDVNMRLRDISALLPYHTEVNTIDVITALNPDDR